MTLFLDGPPPPMRSADKIPSKAPLAAPVTGVRRAPEPTGLTGIPVAPRKPAPTAERQRKNTRLAAIRAAALRAEERREREVEEAATAATATATAEPEEQEDTLVEEEAPTAASAEDLVETTATATTATAPAEPVEETAMADTEKMLAAMRAEPDREWTRAELAELRGTELVPTGTALGKLKREGTIESAGRGLYRWAGGQMEDEAEEAPTPRPRKKASAKKPPRPREEPARQVTQGDGHSRTIHLNSAGTLTVSISASVFELSAADREFLFSLVDSLADYEQGA